MKKDNYPRKKNNNKNILVALWKQRKKKSAKQNVKLNKNLEQLQWVLNYSKKVITLVKLQN